MEVGRVATRICFWREAPDAGVSAGSEGGKKGEVVSGDLTAYTDMIIACQIAGTAPGDGALGQEVTPTFSISG